MRQRKLKFLEERRKAVSHILVKNPEDYKGNWNSLFEDERDLILEIGCGKGKFIVETALANPDKGYIAVEVQPSALVLAAEKAIKAEADNIFFVPVRIDSLESMFEEGELSGIYLNFSDPWPKAKHEKRRLTSGSYLESYSKVLRKGGFLEFKTDNSDLFDFSLEEISHTDFRIEVQSRDLHGSLLAEANIVTEYEDKFIRKGFRINYLKAVLK